MNAFRLKRFRLNATNAMDTRPLDAAVSLCNRLHAMGWDSGIHASERGDDGRMPVDGGPAGLVVSR
jgi:hypothetical protein